MSTAAPTTVGQSLPLGSGRPDDADCTLYFGSGSPPCWRVVATMLEKQIPCRFRMVSFDRREHHSEAFARLNPRKKVPVLRDDDGTVMYESIAIMHHLELCYPETPLLPADRRTRARVLMRMEEAPNLQQASAEIVFYVRRTPAEQRNADYLACKAWRLHEEVALWEGYLEGSEYLAGPGCAFSLADLAFFPVLAYVLRVGLRLDEKRYPNLVRYFQRMATRPSIQRSWPPHWRTEKAPTCLSVANRLPPRPPVCPCDHIARTDKPLEAAPAQAASAPAAGSCGGVQGGGGDDEDDDVDCCGGECQR